MNDFEHAIITSPEDITVGVQDERRCEMTEWQDFERAIINAPEDTPLRLVAADWLEERGDPRGEFIRVQCELARLGPQNELDPGQVEPDCDGCAGEGSDVNGLLQRVPCEKCWANLRARERELWIPETNRLFAQLPQSIIGQAFMWKCPRVENANYAFEWRRGFVEVASCRLADWIGGPCERCVMDGLEYVVDEAAMQMDEITGRQPMVPPYKGQACRICRGTGHTAALGSLLVRAAPLLEVRFTDRELEPSIGVDGVYSVPHSLVNLFKGLSRFHPTLAAAHAALSTAALT